MTNKQPRSIEIGQQVTVRIGGQTHTLTVGDIGENHDGQVAFRSTTPTDHVWTKMWIREECLIDNES